MDFLQAEKSEIHDFGILKDKKSQEQEFDFWQAQRAQRHEFHCLHPKKAQKHNFDFLSAEIAQKHEFHFWQTKKAEKHENQLKHRFTDFLWFLYRICVFFVSI